MRFIGGLFVVAMGFGLLVNHAEHGTHDLPPAPAGSHSVWVSNPDIPGQGMWIRR